MTDDPALAWRGRFPLLVGILSLIILVSGLGAWGLTARLSSAVVASGMVEVESNRQVVQHPDGGVVGAILVDESDVVEKGDVLIQLDGRQLRSELAIVAGQLNEIFVRKHRLVAERDAAERLHFAPDLLALAETTPEIAQMIHGEEALFEARKQSLHQEISLLREQNNQIDRRVDGLEALGIQADLVKADLDNQVGLLESGLTRASRVNELKREEANLRGQIGQLEAEKAELRGQAASNDISLLQLTTNRREEAVSTLRDLQFREIELTEKRLDLEATLSRLDIRAPVAGLVYNLQVFAEQSVVRPADPLLYIIPQDQPLVVAVRVEALNIDDVYVGQDVTLQFPGLKQVDVPELSGTVVRISADVVEDERTGASYYRTDVLPLQSELSKLGDQKLLPGMPVETYIQTGERSALAYLMDPVTAFWGRALRE